VFKSAPSCTELTVTNSLQFIKETPADTWDTATPSNGGVHYNKTFHS